MRRRRYKLGPQVTTFALNITSLTDMFTIMLVFLLQTYSTNEVQIIPAKDVLLPLSNIESTPVKAINISLSAKELRIEDRTIASITAGQFDKRDLDPNDSNFIKPLFDELQKLQKTAKPEDVADGKVFLQADQQLPYQILRQVLYTASMAGFPKLKMATMVGN